MKRCTQKDMFDQWLRHKTIKQKSLGLTPVREKKGNCSFRYLILPIMSIDLL